MPAPEAKKIAIENVNHPGKVSRVDAAKYTAMKAAFLKVLPNADPGITLDVLREAVKPHLPEALFPGGSTAGWWVKAVQLDLEAKGVIKRDGGSPLRLCKV